MPMEPDNIEQKEFLVSLRGYDRDEVDSFLKDVAEEIRKLRARLDRPEEAPPPHAPGAADRESMYRQVGEETSQILLAAEEAGRQIRERAQREAAELVVDARAQADEIARAAADERREAEEDLRKLREARSLLATQLEDVRRRLDETISRLVAPIEAPAPSAPMRPKTQKAQAPASAAPATSPAAPAGAPAKAAPPKAETPAEVARPDLEAPAAAASASAQLKDLLDQSRREREQAKVQVEEMLSQTVAAPVDEALVLRDKALGDIPAAAARRLKRLLQEDQNDLLDRIRTSRGKGTFDADISPPGVQLTRFRDGLHESLEGAFIAGMQTAGASGPGKASAVVADLVLKQIVNPLRREVSRVVESGIEAQDTATSIAERASDVFRVWKGVRTELLGEGLAYSAFHHGMLDAWREQSAATKRWAVSSDEVDCPKGICEGNAAAGAVPLDGAFPSGHHAPPAHGGCTCSLAGEQG